MYPIDEFKYAILLAALEKIKGTKGTINRFIKKVYTETNNLSTRDLDSLRYAFMIITRAIEYSGAINKCNSTIRNRLDYVADVLIAQVTAENVMQTFEFWSSSLCFKPNSLTELKRVDAVMRVLEQSKGSPKSILYTMYDWNIIETRHLEQTKRNFATRMFVTYTIGIDSPILATLLPIPNNFDPTLLVASLEETVSNLQIIIKGTNEYISRSSTTNQ